MLQRAEEYTLWIPFILRYCHCYYNGDHFLHASINNDWILLKIYNFVQNLIYDALKLVVRFTISLCDGRNQQLFLFYFLITIFNFRSTIGRSVYILFQRFLLAGQISVANF